MGSICYHSYGSQYSSISLLLLNTMFLSTELLPQVLKKVTLQVEICSLQEKMLTNDQKTQLVLKSLS